MVPFRLFEVGDGESFEWTIAGLEAHASDWKLADVDGLELAPHVKRHVRSTARTDASHASCALYVRSGSLSHDDLASPISRWTMTAGSGRLSVPFEMVEVDLLVSLLGLAYVTFDVATTSDDPGDLLDLTHYLRQMGSAAPSLSKDGVPIGTLIQVAERLIRPAVGADYSVLEAGAALPFYVAACIDTDGLDEVGQDRVRQRLRRSFHRSQHVEQADLTQDYRHEDRLYRKGQWFFHSQDGGGFVAFDPPDDQFSRAQMWDHVRKAYFFGFQFALLQRHALIEMSGGVADDWLGVVEEQESSSAAEELSARATYFRQLREDLLLFTARFRFAQVMLSQNRHADYRRWLEVLEVEVLHEEVRTEITDMHGYLEELRAQEEDQLRRLEADRLKREEAEQAERILREDRQRAADLESAQQRDRMFGVMATLFVIPSLAIGFFGINIDGFTTGDGMSLTAGLLVVAASVLVSVIVALLVVNWTRSKAK